MDNQSLIDINQELEDLNKAKESARKGLRLDVMLEVEGQIIGLKHRMAQIMDNENAKITPTQNATKMGDFGVTRQIIEKITTNTPLQS